jgi:hypothetical protein
VQREVHGTREEAWAGPGYTTLSPSGSRVNIIPNNENFFTFLRFYFGARNFSGAESGTRIEIAVIVRHGSTVVL